MNWPARIALFAVLFSAKAPAALARQINPRNPPPPPTTEQPAHPAAPVSDVAPIDPTIPPQPPPAEEEAPAEPPKAAFDPLHANRSVDVGTFYLKKGDYDAAIDRFVEATQYEPTLGKPWKLLGDAYEKKHDYAKAAESYKKYLKVFPKAPDAEKVQKRISELQDKASEEKSAAQQ